MNAADGRAAPRWLEQLDALPFDARRLHELRKAIQYRRDRLAQAAS